MAALCPGGGGGGGGGGGELKDNMLAKMWN